MSSMNVRTFESVAVKLPADITILIRGNHGIGKSDLARQLAKNIKASENHKRFPVIDRRLSQMTEGDLIGLPATAGGVTRWCPPDWYKLACDEPCFLFLDELNRASTEVMQAAFQIVLDRELNGHKLHPQTRVMSAINTGGAYTVNEMDPALLDRFWVVDLVLTVEDWLVWAKRPCSSENRLEVKKLFGGTNCLPSIAEFISIESDSWLHSVENSEPGKVGPSPRSWERLGDALALANIHENPASELFYPICIGFIGVEAAIKYQKFMDETAVRFTGEQIVESYKSVRKKIMSKSRAELHNEAIEKTSDYIKTLDNLTEKQGQNLAAFMKDLPGEMRVALWSKISSGGVEKIQLAKSINQYCVNILLDVFGVPAGEEGVGVVPNIPQSTLLTNDK